MNHAVLMISEVVTTTKHLLPHKPLLSSSRSPRQSVNQSVQYERARSACDFRSNHSHIGVVMERGQNSVENVLEVRVVT